MTVAAGASAPRHLDALTGVRGIAAWAVVFYHLRASLVDLFPAQVIDILAKGYLAVDMFFVLSGFVLWYTYADRLRESGGRETGAFLWRRFARIWPLHAFVLCAFIVYVTATALRGGDNSANPVGELPLHFLMIQNWGFTPELTWNNPAWSISTEWAASLLFPLFVIALRWDRMPRIMLPVAACGVIGMIHLVFVLGRAEALGDQIPRLGLARCILEFMLGNLACVMWRAWHKAPAAAPLAAIACGGILAAWSAFNLPEPLAIPAIFLTGILALACDRGPVARLLSTRPLMWLGEVSYSTYLVHVLAFLAFKIAFVDDSRQIGWVGLAAFVAVLLVLSGALYRTIEKPAQRWLNRHPPRVFRKPAPAASP